MNKLKSQDSCFLGVFSQHSEFSHSSISAPYFNSGGKQPRHKEWTNVTRKTVVSTCWQIKSDPSCIKINLQWTKELKVTLKLLTGKNGQHKFQYIHIQAPSKKNFHSTRNNSKNWQIGLHEIQKLQNKGNVSKIKEITLRLRKQLSLLMI